MTLKTSIDLKTSIAQNADFEALIGMPVFSIPFPRGYTNAAYCDGRKECRLYSSKFTDVKAFMKRMVIPSALRELALERARPQALQRRTIYRD